MGIKCSEMTSRVLIFGVRVPCKRRHETSTATMTNEVLQFNLCLCWQVPLQGFIDSRRHFKSSSITTDLSPPILINEISRETSPINLYNVMIHTYVIA